MQGYCPECNEPLSLTAILGGSDKRTEFCPECGWSEQETAEPGDTFFPFNSIDEFSAYAMFVWDIPPAKLIKLRGERDEKRLKPES